MVELEANLLSQLHQYFNSQIKQQFRPKRKEHTSNYILPMKSGMRRPLEALPVGYLKKVSP